MGKYDTNYQSKNKNISDMKYASFFNKSENNSNDLSSKYENKDLYFINLIDIRPKEHFGDALMFLNERSPLFARVKSRYAELLILGKMEAIEIYLIYPNIWKRINKKSLYNMEKIYLKIQKLVTTFLNRDSHLSKNISSNKKGKIKNNGSTINVNKKEKIQKENAKIVIKLCSNINNEKNNSIDKDEDENISCTKNINGKKESILVNEIKKKNKEGKNSKLNKEISNIKTKNENVNIHSSIDAKIFSKDKLVKNDDISNSISIKKSNLKDKEFHKIFTNLRIKQEKSFQLNSSYENINMISYNQYIKNINLQSKIKEILTKELKDINPIKKRNHFLNLQDNIKNLSKTPKSNKKINFTLF